MMLIGVKKRLSSVSTGITNRMICRLEPSAISIAAFILFLAAIMIADECSAAFPMIGTSMIPTKVLWRPALSAIGSTVPTKISDMTAIATVEAISIIIARGRLASWCSSSSGTESS